MCLEGGQKDSKTGRKLKEGRRIKNHIVGELKKKSEEWDKEREKRKMEIQQKWQDRVDRTVLKQRKRRGKNQKRERKSRDWLT